jgi:hypothetical protein
MVDVLVRTVGVRQGRIGMKLGVRVGSKHIKDSNLV